MRVLVAGSRYYPSTEPAREFMEHCITKVLLGNNPPNKPPWTLIAGDARGADAVALSIWEEWEQPAYSYEADWAGPCSRTCNPRHRKLRPNGTDYCPAAGINRSLRMIEEGKPDVVLVFPVGDMGKERKYNRGTFYTARTAKAASIPVIVCHLPDKQYPEGRMEVF